MRFSNETPRQDCRVYMSHKAVFLHVYQHGDEWAKLYEEQIVKLQLSGLYDAADYIFVGVNGNQELPFNLTKVNKVYYNNESSTYQFDRTSELCTLKALYDYSNLIGDGAQILYLQGKGISWSTRTSQAEKNIYYNIQLWRKYLEFFLIENWTKCNELLSEYDIVGAEWKDISIFGERGEMQFPTPHFAGNMWWANSSYIKKLDVNFVLNNVILGRYASELWIGTKSPKHFNLFSSNRNLYYSPILREEYA